ncbi:hypothetical protein J7L68_08195 [bacterium]|nr:hypothetical protein [bacterium]
MKKTLYVSILLLFAISFAQTEVAICTAAGDQLAPRLSAGNDCLFVIWQDHRSGASNQNIFGVSVFADGSLGSAGYPICIAPNNQNSPVIAYDSSTEQFLSVWFDQSTGTEFDGNFLNCDGIVDTNFDIGTATSNLSSPEMASSGSVYMIVWTVRAGADWETKFTVLNSDGTMPGDFENLSNAGSGNPDIAYNGYKFLAVWTDSTDAGQGIFGKYFDSTGHPDGDAFLIIDDSRTSEPAVCGIYNDDPANAGFAIAYQYTDISTGTDIYASIVIGTSVDEFTVNTDDGNQSTPDIANSGNGFLVIWQDASAGMPTIYGNFLSTSGLPIGTKFPFSTAGTSQQAPKVDYIADDSTYLAIWIDYRTANQDIYGAVITPPVPSEGPSVISVSPLLGNYSACDSAMTITLLSENEIDWSTLSLTLNGADYDTSSDEVSTDDLTIYFHPVYSSGIVETMNVCLDDIADTNGAHIDSAYCWSWIWDNSAPFVSNTSPTDGEIIDEMPSTITISVFDSAAGIDSSSIEIDINTSHFTIEDFGIYWDGYTLTLNISELGFMDLPETNMVTIVLNDLADCPNEMEYTFTFYYHHGEGPIAEIIAPLLETITSCPTQNITISINDDDGVDETSIVLMVDGVRYDSLDHMSFIPPNLTFTPGSEYSEGEISVELIDVKDLLGNSISTPLTYNFIVDKNPPQITDITFPDGTELDTMSIGDLLITTEDNYCSSLSIDMSYILLSHYGGGLIERWEDSSLISLDDTTFGIAESIFFDAIDSSHTTSCDTFQICTRVADNPDYSCPYPNMLDTCWLVIYHGSGINESKIPDNVKLDFSPNPFNSSLDIKYAAPDGGKIEIFDNTGHLIRRYPIRGNGTFVWDCCDDEGLPMQSGRYTIRLMTSAGSIVKNATLLK